MSSNNDDISLFDETINLEEGYIGVEAPVRAKEDSGLIKFKSVCSQLERHNAKAIEGTFAEVDFGHAEVLLDLVKGYWKALMDAHVSAYDKERSAMMDEALEVAESHYSTVVLALNKRLESGKAGKVVQPAALTELTNTWGEFDGSLKKWPGFRDRFKEAVHNNANVPPTFKFQYLIQSMQGNAAQALGEWHHTGKNYELAWERLLQMYDTKYLVCHELLNEFERLPRLTGKANASFLQRMVNVTHETVRQLTAQGVSVVHWDVRLVFMWHSRLDEETSRKWELHGAECADPELPTISEMLKFLKLQAAAMQRPVWERVGVVHGKERGHVVEREFRTERYDGQGHSDRAGRDAVHTMRGHMASTERMCSYCSSYMHPIWECPQFTTLSFIARKEVVYKKGLCMNCLKVGHTKQQCYQGPCIRCKGRQMQNSLLCPIKLVLVVSTARAASPERAQKRVRNEESKINRFKRYSVLSYNGKGFAFMPTALIRVEVNGVRLGPIRALLDTGAQPNLIHWEIDRPVQSKCRGKGKVVVGIGGMA